MEKDIREEFIDKVLSELVSVLNNNQLSAVSLVITDKLHDYELSAMCTEIMAYDGQNEELVKMYVASLMIEGKSANSAKAYTRELKKLIEVIPKRYTDVKTNDVRYYLGTMMKRGLKGSTVENARAYISAFYMWLYNEGYIEKNPCASIKPIKVHKDIKIPFSQTDIDKIRTCCKTQRDRAIVEVLLSSGIRLDELCKLDRSDVNFETLELFVRHGKGDKARKTYINDVAAMHLKKYLLQRKDGNMCMFYSRNNSRISGRSVSLLLNEIQDESGVSNIHPHRFRRTFASNMAQRGMNVQAIQILLGHSNISTTMTYIYTSEDQIVTQYKQFAC